MALFADVKKITQALTDGSFDSAFEELYGRGLASQKSRYMAAAIKFGELFGEDRPVAFFSAPGRTEICGNHTDHQHGRVLAAAIGLDAVAIASASNNSFIRVYSQGFGKTEIFLDTLEALPEEKGTTAALVRGIAAEFLRLGYKCGGFDAYVTSDVLMGSGLSSSAAFEVLIATIINALFNASAVSAVQTARIAQYAENVYFGKPCGLMDQTASAVGGVVMIDFFEPSAPVIETIDFDIAKYGYALCIVDTGASHADLTDEYSAIPAEMRAVAAALGAEYLRHADKQLFYSSLGELSKTLSHRALLRAFHFFEEDERVSLQAAALKTGDFEAFKRLVLESGRSSAVYLQNIFSCSNPREQRLSLALAISERLLEGRGAFRVHGGGFGGTIQAFVPFDLLERYKRGIEKFSGKNSCFVLAVRKAGAVLLGA